MSWRTFASRMCVRSSYAFFFSWGVWRRTHKLWTVFRLRLSLSWTILSAGLAWRICSSRHWLVAIIFLWRNALTHYLIVLVLVRSFIATTSSIIKWLIAPSLCCLLPAPTSSSIGRLFPSIVFKYQLICDRRLDMIITSLQIVLSSCIVACWSVIWCLSVSLPLRRWLVICRCWGLRRSTRVRSPVIIWINRGHLFGFRVLRVILGLSSLGSIRISCIADTRSVVASGRMRQSLICSNGRVRLFKFVGLGSILFKKQVIGRWQMIVLVILHCCFNLWWTETHGAFHFLNKFRVYIQFTSVVREILILRLIQ